MDSLVEETEPHFLVGFLLLLLLLLHLGRGSFLLSSSSGCCGGRGSGSEGSRVGQHVLDLLGLVEGVRGGQRDGQNVLVTTGDRVRQGGDGRKPDLESEAGNVP